MADEEQKQPENLKQPQSSFDKMSSIEPRRDVDLPDNTKTDDGGHGSIEERMEGSPKLSDVQTVIKQLFPNIGIDWLNTLQMARVFPEYYVPLKRIIVKHLVKDKGMSVAQAIGYAEVAVGIPIDGEGRIDAIAVMGRAADAEETKSKNEAGLP